MAKGRKTGGRDYTPGHAMPGPGRPQLPEDLKKSRSLNRIEFERILNKYIFSSGPEINNAIKSPDTPIIEGIVAKILAKAFNEGDQRRLEFLLDRLIGRPKECLPEPVVIDAEFKTVRTFEEFCSHAGYPKPYPKQVEMVDFALRNGDISADPRMLLGSRGYGKTDYVTILGVAHYLYKEWKAGRHPEALIITKSKTRNQAIIAEIAAALKANGVPLEKENSSCLRIEGKLGKDHSCEAITLRTSLRGRHPNVIIFDDIVTEEDVSEAMRILVKRKYSEAYKLCKNIVIIGQPAHADDLYAELREKLTLMEVPHGTIVELDADLEAMEAAGIDPVSISMSYKLIVPKEGTTIFANLKFVDDYPAGDSIAFIDPSDGGDLTALTVGRGYLDGVALEGHAWKRAWYHCLDEIVAVLKARKVRRVCFETNHAGTQPIVQLIDLLKPLGIGVVGVHSDSNKHAVIQAAGSYSHLLHLSKKSMPVYTERVLKYEKGCKLDDPPDSLARLLVWMGLIRGKK